eukprot:gene5989-7638_t
MAHGSLCFSTVSVAAVAPTVGEDLVKPILSSCNQMKLNNVGVRLCPKLSQLVDSTSAFVSHEERNDESYARGDRGVGDVNPEPQVIVPAPAPESDSAKDIYALGRVLSDMLSHLSPHAHHNHEYEKVAIALAKEASRWSDSNWTERPHIAEVVHLLEYSFQSLNSRSHASNDDAARLLRSSLTKSFTPPLEITSQENSEDTELAKVTKRLKD